MWLVYLRGQQLRSWHLWCPRSNLILQYLAVLQRNDVVFHALDVYLIVEVNYIFSFPIEAWHLHIDIDDTPLALEHFRVFVDDVIKLDLQAALHLAYTVDSAHYHLIKHAVNKELRLG